MWCCRPDQIGTHQGMTYMTCVACGQSVELGGSRIIAKVAECIVPLEAAQDHIGVNSYEEVFECGTAGQIKLALIRALGR